jgi:hypothetical protein
MNETLLLLVKTAISLFLLMNLCCFILLLWVAKVVGMAWDDIKETLRCVLLGILPATLFLSTYYAPRYLLKFIEFVR